MTVMAHPSPNNIERYRVQDKVLGIQEYFSVAKHGLEGALQKAQERQSEIDKVRAVRDRRMQLSISRLFEFESDMVSGRLTKVTAVKGLKRIYRIQHGREARQVLRAAVGVGYKRQKTKEITLQDDNFDQAWSDITQWMLDTLEIESSQEIRLELKNIKSLYNQDIQQPEGVKYFSIPNYRKRNK